VTSWSDARTLAHAAATPLPAGPVPLAKALGCVLAGELRSLTALPSFDTAAMDGWAVRGPGPWRVVGTVLAGHPIGFALAPGEAVEIATGAQVPAGTEGVLPVESGAVVGDGLRGDDPHGRHVRRSGEECPADGPLLPAGGILTPAALGLAAAVGHDCLTVHPLARVTALVTGDEVLQSGLPGAGRVRDAVGPLLAGAVGCCGGRLLGVEHVADDRDLLRAAVAASSGDVVVTSGASSVGRADFLAAVLDDLGAEVLLAGVAVRPGHPQLLARLTDGRFVVGLPGNPLAALAGIVTVLAPLLAGLAGQALPGLGTARAGEPLPSAPSAVRLVPVRLRDNIATPTGHGGSAMLRGAAVADAFAVLPPGRAAAAGDTVETVALPQ
jgi:molybdopterin molybdotransferase